MQNDARPRVKCVVCGKHFIVRHKGFGALLLRVLSLSPAVKPRLGRMYVRARPNYCSRTSSGSFATALARCRASSRENSTNRRPC